MLDGMRARFVSAQLQVQAQIEAGPLQVDGDERRLQQLLGNLLENTLRYTDAGGTEQLRCVRRGALLEWVVEDSAPGVEADKHARLLERFHRTEPRAIAPAAAAVWAWRSAATSPRRMAVRSTRRPAHWAVDAWCCACRR